MKKHTWYTLFAAIFLGFVLIMLALPWLLERTAASLITDKSTPKADIIVVLAGDNGERVREGVRLYQKGVAPKLLMSGGAFFDSSMGALMADYAIRLGVPTEDILIEDTSVSTHTNATECLPILTKIHAKHILVVTSRFHTSRSYSVFREVLPDTMEVFIHGAEDGVDYKRWYHDGEMTETILIELGKTLYYRLKY